MASLNYADIVSRVLNKITDYDFLKYEAEDIETELTEKMKIALSKPYLRRIFSSLSYDDIGKTMAYTLKYNTDADADADFVAEAIALGVVVAWLEPQINTTLLTHQMITSSKESKFYAQANQLGQLKDLLATCRKEQRFLIQDRGWINNGYING